MALRIGLTGGIGSGKSTVAGFLAGHGATVIDADAIARATTAPGGAAVPAIVAAFGPEMVAADGGLDRARMRERVFRDADARRRLEAIVHPAVSTGCEQQARAATAAGARVLIFDVPLLVESGHWRRRVDRVLVVDCSRSTQVARVVQRSGLAPDAVQAIIASQAPRAVRLAAADMVVHNEDLALPALNGICALLARSFGL